MTIARRTMPANHRQVLVAAALCTAGAFLPTKASAQDPDSWKFGAMLYGYFPDISGKSNVPVGSGSVTIDFSDIFDQLQFGFLGAFEARKGRWGVFTDLMYLDVGNSASNSRSFEVGRRKIPGNVTANVDVNMTTWVWTTAASYALIAEPGVAMDLFAGARMLKVKADLDWQLSGNVGQYASSQRAGSSDLSETVWDGIVGAKGRFAFGGDGKWFIPYYVDVGTGQTKLSWQAAGGVGYSYGWGEVVAGWRYLDYTNNSGEPIASLAVSGPMIGAQFRW